MPFYTPFVNEHFARTPDDEGKAPVVWFIPSRNGATGKNDILCMSDSEFSTEVRYSASPKISESLRVFREVANGRTTVKDAVAQIPNWACAAYCRLDA